MEVYSSEQFKSKVNRALEEVHKVLESNRRPELASEVSHRYTDKYLLAEFLTNTTIISILNCFEAIGLTKENLKTLKEWSNKRSVTIRFESRETCDFTRSLEREVESPVSHVTEISAGPLKTKVTNKVITKVTEYFWNYKVQHQLFFYQGPNPNNSESRLDFQSHTGQTELITTTEHSPKTKSRAPTIYEFNITWLLKFLSPGLLEASFSINRDSTACRTPRRNPEILSGFEFIHRFSAWIIQIDQHFQREIFPSQKNHALDLSVISREHFIPVLPLLEERVFAPNYDPVPQNSLVPLQFQTLAADNTSTTLPFPDLVALLNEQRRQLTKKIQTISGMFPQGDDSLITVQEIELLASLAHAKSICAHWKSSLDLIEKMLHDQLIAALGKEVRPLDFDQYMNFHFRKHFRSEFAPRAFSYAVRRPDHSPEGEISIEALTDSDGIPQPILTIVRHSAANRPMFFQLNASTRVGFLGDRFVHAWIGHQFENQNTTNSLRLVARARQFSSFILLLGSIANEDTFLPQHALIIQNKDDLRVPLILEQIPSAKEFRDAIESLSPEQQAFARAFRSMQLAGSLFAICVLQIKPQLERVLNLPPDSLTKEIQLSQELLKFFMDYQIPSDLLSFGGNPGASQVEKLNAVKTHAAAMTQMIAESKQRELDEQKMKAEMARAEAVIAPPPPPTYSGVPVSMRLCSAPPPVQSARFSRGGMAPKLASVCAPPPAPGGFCAPPPPSPVNSAPPPPAPTPSLPPPPPPPSQPSPSPSEPAREPEPEQIYEKNDDDGQNASSGELTVNEDYTKIPAALDKRLLELDEDGAVRSTIVKAGIDWERKAQKGLLSGPAKEFSPLLKDQQKTEKNSAFDLLDALSRSGALCWEDASFHVLLASTHCFDKSIINTLVQDNVNPISKVERSALIISSLIHQQPPEALIRPDQLSRVNSELPRLFLNE